MRAFSRGAALTLVMVALAACKALPLRSSADAGLDLAASSDFSVNDGGGDALACPPQNAEICGNGCDDDRNGYTDDDDPACTTQMLVTLNLQQPNPNPSLSRLILSTPPKLVVVDGNPVSAGAFATFNRLFSPAYYLAFEGGTKLLERRMPDGGITDTSLPYSARDVCVFNGQLIVLENLNATMGQLQRFMPDGKTEIMPPVSFPAIVNACASDGKYLYLTRHDVGGASEFWVLDQALQVVAMKIPLPPPLAQQGYDRCVDFAWTKKSGALVGLFAQSGGLSDAFLDGKLLAAFWLDGGVGAAIDAGVYHSAGEFLP
jgi:hypothetical protein